MATLEINKKLNTAVANYKLEKMGSLIDIKDNSTILSPEISQFINQETLSSISILDNHGIDLITLLENNTTINSQHIQVKIIIVEIKKMIYFRLLAPSSNIYQKISHLKATISRDKFIYTRYCIN